MYYPTISPHDSARVLLRCDMTGAYITEDAGASWRMFNLRTTTSFFVFDPADPQVIYDYGLGLWRSADAGKTWSLVYPNPATVMGIKVAGDHGEESIVSNAPPLGIMTALAVDPEDSDVLYAVINNVLYISTDRGSHWIASNRLTDGGSKIRTVALRHGAQRHRGLHRCSVGLSRQWRCASGLRHRRSNLHFRGRWQHVAGYRIAPRQ